MLDQLPLELQQRIVSALDFPSLLSLSLTCRVLHGACQNATVVRDIIRNRNGYGGPVWKYPDFFEKSSSTELARYALADALASQDRFKRAHPMVNVDIATASWVPQLVALKHPFFASFDVRLFCHVVHHSDSPLWKQYSPFSHHGYGQSFCMAARLISTKPPNDLPLEFSQCSLSPNGQDLWPTADSDRIITDEPLRRHLEPRHSRNLFRRSQEVDARWSELQRLNVHVRANVEVGIIALTLRETLARNGGGRDSASSLGLPRSSTSSTSQLPTLPDIPFHTFMHLPKLFAPNAAEDFAFCHLAEMTTPEFLEDGEWMGFYSVPDLTTARNTAKYDLPMLGINFSARDLSPAGPVELIAMDGRDGVGAFSLVGTVSKSSGWVDLRKEYSTMAGATGGSLSWDWSGVVTPFGIVCTWGHPHWGGWVWLWKTKWTVGRQRVCNCLSR